MLRKKYFIYVRVSDTDYSYKNQIELCEKCAEKNFIHWSEIEYLKEEMSGKEWWARPLFNKMMELLKIDSEKPESKKEYGGIIFFKIDRLARNHSDFNQLEYIFENGYQLISCTETIENTPTGKLLFRILSSFAIYESEKLSNRISISYIIRVLQQKFSKLGSDKEPFWYKLSSDGETLMIDKNEQKIIIYAYDLYLWSQWKENESYKRIAELVEQKYPWAIKKHLIDGKKKTTPERFINNIIVNDHKYKYNGVLLINININDELVKNYLALVKERENYDFEIAWDLRVGNHITFVFSVPELAILPDHIYQKARHKSDARKNKDRILDEDQYQWMFSKILSYGYDGAEVQMKGYFTSKWTIQYRTMIDNENKELSENKIETAINNLNALKKIEALPKDKMGEVFYILRNHTKKKFEIEKRQAQMRINTIKPLIEHYQRMLEESNDPIKLQGMLSAKLEAERLVEHYDLLKKDITASQDNEIGQFIACCDLKQLWRRKQSALEKMQLYQVLIEKLYLMKDGKIRELTIHFNDFICEIFEIEKSYKVEIE